MNTHPVKNFNYMVKNSLDAYEFELRNIQLSLQSMTDDEKRSAETRLNQIVKLIQKDLW